MLITHQNLLSEKELFFLESICSTFAPTDSASVINNKNNYYIRKTLNIEKDLLEYQKRCKELIDDEYDLFGLWINKVTIETNIDDEYHNDTCDLTIVTYINDAFDGGEFEYFENKNLFKIKPIRNKSLFMDNKLKHRVLKVTKNERYSLISFYYKNKKKEKTTI
jgi:Rps23 Pro-64 3,4-dihydroxylase Tpa1-like proline 4-hydroxylase